MIVFLHSLPAKADDVSKKLDVLLNPASSDVDRKKADHELEKLIMEGNEQARAPEVIDKLIPALLSADNSQELRYHAANVLRLIGEQKYNQKIVDAFAQIIGGEPNEMVFNGASWGMQRFARVFGDPKDRHQNPEQVLSIYSAIIDKQPVKPGRAQLDRVRSLLFRMTDRTSQLANKVKQNEIIEKLFTRRGLPDICVTLCDHLVAEYGKWVQTHYLQPEFKYQNDTWAFALTTLSAYFIVKAAPLCPKAIPLRNSIMQQLAPTSGVSSAEPCEICKDDTLLMAFEKYSKKVMGSGAHSSDSPGLLGKAFYLMLLKELAKTSPTVPGVDRKIRDAEKELPVASTSGQRAQIKANSNSELLELLKKSEASLGEDTRDSDKKREGVDSLGRIRNSFMSTFSVAVCTLASGDPSPDNITELKKAFDPAKPTIVHYYPNGEPDVRIVQTERSSAARAVPLHLALYENAKSPDEKEKARGNLIAAVQNYRKYLIDLLLVYGHFVPEVDQSPHVGIDGLAGFYPYATALFATESLDRLIKDTPAGDKKGQDEIKELEGLRESLKVTLLSQVDPKTGLFEPTGTTTYPSSAGYVNPLAGLALIPLIDKCGGKQ